MMEDIIYFHFSKRWHVLKLNFFYLSVQKTFQIFIHAWILGRNNFTAVALETFIIFSFNFIVWPVSKFPLYQRSQKFIHQSISFCFNGLQQHVAKLIQRKTTFCASRQIWIFYKFWTKEDFWSAKACNTVLLSLHNCQKPLLYGYTIWLYFQQACSWGELEWCMSKKRGYSMIRSSAAMGNT